MASTQKATPASVSVIWCWAGWGPLSQSLRQQQATELMKIMLGLLDSGDASFLFIQLFLRQLPQLVRTAWLPGNSRGSQQDTAGILAVLSTVRVSHAATVPATGSGGDLHDSALDIITIAILARMPSPIYRPAHSWISKCWGATVPWEQCLVVDSVTSGVFYRPQQRTILLLLIVAPFVPSAPGLWLCVSMDVNL